MTENECGKEAKAWFDFFQDSSCSFPSVTPFLIISFEILLFLPLLGKIIESVFAGMCGERTVTSDHNYIRTLEGAVTNIRKT